MTIQVLQGYAIAGDNAVMPVIMGDKEKYL
jgi:hypothetical protein